MSTAPNELKNGIKNNNLSFFYKRAKSCDWTSEDGKKVLVSVLAIKSAQLHKSIYYGLELIHRITRINSRGQAKFRDYVMDTLQNNSISFATGHLEMIADFNMYGQTNGVLGHYYQKCFEEGLTQQKQIDAMNDFVNFAAVHSYVTGVNDWLAAIFLDIEEQEMVKECEAPSDRLAKIAALVAEIALVRPSLYATIDEMRTSRASEEYTPIISQFAAVPITLDDSERVYEFEAAHNRADTLVEQLAPTK